ncbi:ArsR/SmtB family transcription factor [Bacteroides graminisolvens]|uniref:ArsR/SmtB family transcription factor n=1 Tax=Bacteroides graminisolvens TaxID=477666 RepID=UPI003B6EE679
MAGQKYTDKQIEIARFAKALSNPARIAILEFLASQDTCFFGDIHEVLPIAKATVSQHLKELKEAGLIQGEIEAPKVKYCIQRDNWNLAKSIFGEFFRIYSGEKCRCD